MLGYCPVLTLVCDAGALQMHCHQLGGSLQLEALLVSVPNFVRDGSEVAVDGIHRVGDIVTLERDGL